MKLYARTSNILSSLIVLHTNDIHTFTRLYTSGIELRRGVRTVEASQTEITHSRLALSALFFIHNGLLILAYSGTIRRMNIDSNFSSEAYFFLYVEVFFVVVASM